MCRQAHHRAIAEHIVLAIDQAQLMPRSKSRGLKPYLAMASGPMPHSIRAAAPAT